MKAKRTIAPDPARGERFPRLHPFPRCRCGQCRDCKENERWDRIFARFEVKKYWEDRGLLQSTLRGL
jgi:hypothetical protein